MFHSKEQEEYATIVLLDEQGKEIISETLPKENVSLFFEPDNIVRLLNGPIREGVKVVLFQDHKIITFQFVKVASNEEGDLFELRPIAKNDDSKFQQ